MAKTCDGRLEFQIIFIPSANCSSGEQTLPSWATCSFFSPEFQYFMQIVESLFLGENKITFSNVIC